MFHQGLAAFGLRPDLDLHLDRVTGSQAELAARLGEELDEALGIDPPAAVVVQGDTTTALVGGAEPRSGGRFPSCTWRPACARGDLASPFPEEGNRRLIGQVAALHLAPTAAAADNLADEAVLGGRSVLVTGNTVVDAVAVRRCPAAPSRDPGPDPAAGAGPTPARAGWCSSPCTAASPGATRCARVLGAVARPARGPPRRRRSCCPRTRTRPSRGRCVAVLGDHARVAVTEPLDYPDLVAAAAPMPPSC